MKILPISKLEADTKYEGLLMVKSIDEKIAQSTKKYFAIILTDGSSDIECKFFNTIENHTQLKGKILLINLKTQVYNNKFCGIIDTYKEETNVDSAIKEQFIKFSTTTFNLENFKNSLLKIINTIEDIDIRRLCTYVFLEKYKIEFETYPAGKTNHHAGYGGLLEHSISLANLGILTIEYYSYQYSLNQDLVIAGSLFQDIGKIYEFDLDEFYNVTYSKLAALKGHIIISNEILYNSLYELNMNPLQDKFAKLSHIILSHQSQLDYGSPVIPCIPEAILVSKLDKLDSEMKASFTAIQETRISETFTKRSMTLQNGYVLMPEVSIYDQIESHKNESKNHELF